MSWSTLAYIVFVCLAAASTFLLAFFAARVNTVKDRELKRLQSNSAEVVAHAQTGAARAAAEAAEAHKEQRRVEIDMAHAWSHNEQLRKENLELQLVLEQERAARLRLEERLGDRHITDGQKQAIRTALAAFRGQKVSMFTHAGDAESTAFASEIKASLAAAGIVASVAPALVAGKPQPGIALEVGTRRRQFAAALARAFVDAGVCSGPITASEPDDADLLEITVGPKP